MNKKVIIFIAIAIVLIIGIVAISSNKDEKDKPEEKVDLSNTTYISTKDGEKVNTSEALLKEKMVNGLKFTNIQITTNKNGKTTILADVENTNAEATKLQFVTISILDKQGQEMSKVDGMIVALDSGQKTQLNAGVPSSSIEAYDFTITAK